MPESNVTIIAHFLKGNLKSVPSHALFPNPGLCLVTYTINKAVAFIEINREMCGDRARQAIMSHLKFISKHKPAGTTSDSSGKARAREFYLLLDSRK